MTITVDDDDRDLDELIEWDEPEDDQWEYWAQNAQFSLKRRVTDWCLVSKWTPPKISLQDYWPSDRKRVNMVVDFEFAADPSAVVFKLMWLAQ
jgi:hypothetical protein